MITSHQPNKLLHPKIFDKKEFTKMLRNYIKHCKMVSMNSYSDYYRTMKKALAWDAIYDLDKTLMNADTVPLQQLKYFTRLKEKPLLEILPHSENPSYKNQFELITQIIAYVKQ